MAVRRLKLLREPRPEAEVIKLLQVNDQVEKLDQNPAGWVKVRQPASGAVGWVQGRYLEPLPVRYPRPEKPRKRSANPNCRSPPRPNPSPNLRSCRLLSGTGCQPVNHQAGGLCH